MRHVLNDGGFPLGANTILTAADAEKRHDELKIYICDECSEKATVALHKNTTVYHHRDKDLTHA